jgi:hypothetical protein
LVLQTVLLLACAASSASGQLGPNATIGNGLMQSPAPQFPTAVAPGYGPSLNGYGAMPMYPTSYGGAAGPLAAPPLPPLAATAMMGSAKGGGKCGDGTCGNGTCGGGMCGNGMCGALGACGGQGCMGCGGGDACGNLGCTSCRGIGCGACTGSGTAGGLLEGCLGLLLPYGEGGCCAPRWYDITAEFLYLQREDAGRSVPYSSIGLQNIVMSTDDLGFQEEGNLRFTAAMQIWAGSNLEFTYLGLGDWASSTSVTSPTDQLFSPFSDFGAGSTADEVDNARFHRISYSGGFDSFELSWRKRWTGPNCRLQGSWLAGVRYIYVLEDFEYYTIGGFENDPTTGLLRSRGRMDYDIRTKNSLTGFQMGGDLWTCIIPGVRLGGELKAGIYGNYAQYGNDILATTTSPAQANRLREADTTTDATFVTEASLALLYRISPNWTLRGGYHFLYLDGIALAPENFNSTYPFDVARTPASVNDNGNLFYHGFSMGAEWMW